MVLPIAVALMGMGAVRRFQQDRQDQADIEEERSYQRRQRQRTEAQQAEEDNTRASMRMAGPTATIDPNMVKSADQDNRDVGQPGEAAPTQQGFNVKGQQFATMEEATKARDAYNAPDAVTARMSDVYMRAGRPADALQLRTGARQEKVANLQADQLQQAADRDKKLREAGAMIIKGGWAAVPEVYSRYDDGMSAKVEQDGKGGATVVMLDATGKEAGRKQYTSLPDFFADVAGQFDPSKWQAHQEKKAEQVENTRRWNAEMDLRRTEAERRAKHEARMLEIAQGKNSQPAPIWDEKADSWLRQRYTAKDELTGVSKVDGDGLLFAKQIALAAARDRFGGDTTSALGYAFDMDQKIAAAADGDPAKIRAGREQALAALTALPKPPMSKAEMIQRDRAKDGTKDFIVDINGRRAAYGNAKMSDFDTSAVGANFGKAPPVPPPPQAQPQGPMASVMQYLSELGKDYDTEEGKALLAARVAEASKGGKGLSQVEALRARQLGLLGKAAS